MITAVLTCAPVPAGTDGQGTEKRGLSYGGSEKREGRRFVGRQVLRGSEASPLIVGGNGHGCSLNEKGETERAEGAMVVCPVVTRWERGAGLAFGGGAGHRRRFAEGRAEGRRFVGARFAYRRLRRGGEHLKDQHPEEDSPEEGSGEHFWDSTSPYPGLAIEITLNSHCPVFRGRVGARTKYRWNRRLGETRAGSSPPFGTPLPEEMRSLGYPTKNNLRGTIAILKGNLASRQVLFFVNVPHAFHPSIRLIKIVVDIDEYLGPSSQIWKRTSQKPLPQP
jgi:hypothetical protein